MAAKGSILKGEITQKILAAFPGSFLYNDGKEIRINGSEAGVPLQIKVTLTAAKEPVESITVTSDTEAPVKVEWEGTPAVKTIAPAEAIPAEPTDEEKTRLKTLLKELGL